MILLSQTLKRQALTNAAQSSFKTIVKIHSTIEIATKTRLIFSADEKEN